MKDSNYERIYTGSSIKINYLKDILEEEGIKTIVRNDQESQLTAGFGGNYSEQALIFAEKSDSMRAKRIAERVMEKEAIPAEILEQEATKSRLEDETEVKKSATRPLINKDKKPKRSVFNIILNVILIIVSLWRLSPLLYGETLAPWRIALSSVILIFCSYTVISHFKK